MSFYYSAFLVLFVIALIFHAVDMIITLVKFYKEKSKSCDSKK